MEREREREREKKRGRHLLRRNLLRVMGVGGLPATVAIKRRAHRVGQRQRQRLPRHLPSEKGATSEP